MPSTSQHLSPYDIPQRPGFARTPSSQSVNSETSTNSARSSSRSSTTSRLHASLFPEKDKPRLYIGLFSRGGSTPTYASQLTCENYHWTLIVGPKSPARSQVGKMYHLVHAPNDSRGTTLRYEEINLDENPQTSSKLLVRIALAKVLDQDRLEQLLRSIKIPASSALSSPPPRHIRSHSSSSDDENDDDASTHSCASYTCMTFVREAFNLLTDPQRSGKSQKPLKSYFSDDDWKDIEWRTRKYMKKKRTQGRFRADGRRDDLLVGAATWNVEEVATWNFWENRETTD